MIISTNWHNSKQEAWRQFNLEHDWKVKSNGRLFKWLREPEVLEENGRFKVEGVAQ